MADCPAVETQVAEDCLAAGIPEEESPVAEIPVAEIPAAEIPAAESLAVESLAVDNRPEAGKTAPADNHKEGTAHKSDNSVESRPAGRAGTPRAAARVGKVCSNSHSNSRPSE